MRSSRAKFLGFLMLVAVAGLAVPGASPPRSWRPAAPGPAVTPAQQTPHASTDRVTSRGGLTGNRYSTLNQINTSNVGHLKVAWQAHFGLSKALQAKSFGMEATPVVFDGVAYVPDPFGSVIALDGATGETQWKYTHRYKGKRSLLTTQRGIAIGDGRVYVGTPDGTIVALNQATGRPEWQRKVG